MDTSRPVEFYIGRAIDPFSDAEIRLNSTSTLREKVNSETVEALVQNCGSRIHNHIGKFKFLNQMTKLVAPQLNEGRTSEAVRDKAVALLFTWQKQMKHIEKFKETYENLRQNGVITVDPVIDADAIPTIPPPSPKRACFEDSEKADLLKQLLSSNDPNDLQAANRLIKSLVRTEDLKLEKTLRRQEEIDRARRTCECMEHLLFQSQEHLGLATGIIETDEIRSVYDSLLSLRPSLYRYAGEAAENNEDILAEILSLNDLVNRQVLRYQALFEPKKDANGHEKDLLGGEMTFEDEVRTPPVQWKWTTFWIAAMTFTDQMAQQPSPSTSKRTVDQISYLGISAQKVGGSSRCSSTSDVPLEVLSDFSSLVDGGTGIFQPSQPSPLNSGLEKTSKDIFYPETLQDIHFPLENVQLAPAAPIEVINSNSLRLFVHLIRNKPSSSSPVRAVLLSLLNLGCVEIRSARIAVNSVHKSVHCHLLPASLSSLQPYSTIGVPCIKQILLIASPSLVGEAMEADFEVRLSVSGKIVADNLLTGTFRVPL